MESLGFVLDLKGWSIDLMDAYGRVLTYHAACSNWQPDFITCTTLMKAWWHYNSFFEALCAWQLHGVHMHCLSEKMPNMRQAYMPPKNFLLQGSLRSKLGWSWVWQSKSAHQKTFIMEHFQTWKQFIGQQWRWLFWERNFRIQSSQCYRKPQ